MSDGPVAASPSRAPSDRPASRRWLPFWLLQAAELALAVVFVDLSVHVANGKLLVGGAIVLAVLALTGSGPLGLVKVCPPRVHVVVVTVVALLLAVAPVVPTFRPDIQGIIVLLFCVVGLVRLAMLTRTTPPVRGAGAGHGPGQVIDASATVHDGPRNDAAGGSAAVGGSAAAATPGGPATAARRAGQAAGLAATLGRRAAGRHRPVAEARVKRAVRGAGRMVGSWTAGGDPPGGAPAPAPGDGRNGTVDRAADVSAPGPGEDPEPTTP